MVGNPFSRRDVLKGTAAVAAGVFADAAAGRGAGGQRHHAGS